MEALGHDQPGTSAIGLHADRKRCRHLWRTENDANICGGPIDQNTDVIRELKLYEYTLYLFIIGFIFNSVTKQLSYHIITKKVV